MFVFNKDSITESFITNIHVLLKPLFVDILPFEIYMLLLLNNLFIDIFVKTLSTVAFHCGTFVNTSVLF